MELRLPNEHSQVSQATTAELRQLQLQIEPIEPQPPSHLVANQADHYLVRTRSFASEEAVDTHRRHTETAGQPSAPQGKHRGLKKMLSTIAVDELPELTSTLDRASRAGEKALSGTFPASTVVALFDKLRRLLEPQPTLVEVCVAGARRIPLQLKISVHLLSCRPAEHRSLPSHSS